MEFRYSVFVYFWFVSIVDVSRNFAVIKISVNTKITKGAAY